MNYTPQPGTLAHRIVEHLRAQPPGTTMTSVQLAEALDVDDSTYIIASLVAAVKHGVVHKDWQADNKRLLLWSLGDGTPQPKPDDHEPDEPLNTAPMVIPKFASLWPGLATAPADTRSRLTIANEHAWASGKQPHRRGKTPDVGAKPGKPPTPTQGATPVKPRKATGPAEYADIDSMQITDDPITPRTASSGDKYGPLFAKMKLGQSIKCRSEDAPKVGNALRKWRDANCPDAEVRAVRHYPGDNMGRVWLLEPVKKAA